MGRCGGNTGSFGRTEREKMTFSETTGDFLRILFFWMDGKGLRICGCMDGWEM